MQWYFVELCFTTRVPKELLLAFFQPIVAWSSIWVFVMRDWSILSTQISTVTSVLERTSRDVLNDVFVGGVICLLCLCVYCFIRSGLGFLSFLAVMTKGQGVERLVSFPFNPRYQYDALPEVQLALNV